MAAHAAGGHTSFPARKNGYLKVEQKWLIKRRATLAAIQCGGRFDILVGVTGGRGAKRGIELLHAAVCPTVVRALLRRLDRRGILAATNKCRKRPVRREDCAARHSRRHSCECERKVNLHPHAFQPRS